jgi:hypothetical protein
MKYEVFVTNLMVHFRRNRAFRRRNNMASNEPEEIRTTIALDTRLHVWLRQYAIGRRISFVRLVAGILTEWAKSHGYSEQPEESSQDTQP